jgi:hypothetical protein
LILTGEDGASPPLLPSAFSIRQPLDPTAEAKLAALIGQAAS